MVSVFATPELLDLGFTNKRIETALSCCLLKVRRGHFALVHACQVPEHQILHEAHAATETAYPQHFGDIRDNSEWLRILIRSYADELSSDTAFSHISAALIHQLDPPFPATTVAETIRPEFHRRTRTMRIRQRRLEPSEVTMIGDLRVTTVRQTLLDIAHDYPLEVSVPFISEALRKGLTTRGELREGTTAGKRGCKSAVQALDIASGAHESASESLCAVKFHRFGIRGMVPQVDTVDSSGAWIARNDFRHETLPLIVECHGVGKYYLSDGGPDQASRHNHERHMKLLNAGFRVFNLVWADLFRAREFRKIKSTLEALEKEAATRPIARRRVERTT